MAHLDWFAVLADADGGWPAAGVVMSEAGRAQIRGPYASTALIAPTVVTHFGSPAQRGHFLPQITEGRALVSTTVAALGWANSHSPIIASTTPRSGGWLLNGAGCIVADADIVDYLLVAASTGGDSSASPQVMMLVDRRAPGINTASSPSAGSERLFAVSFSDVTVSVESVLADLSAGDAAFDEAVTCGAVAECAYLAGAAERLLELTVDYARQRSQSGRPIGAYQAVQARCVDLMTEARSIACITHDAVLAQATRVADRHVRASLAKAWSSEAYVRATRLAHRVHGALGFSSEYLLEPFTRHALTARSAFGDARFHRSRLASLTEGSAR